MLRSLLLVITREDQGVREVIPHIGPIPIIIPLKLFLNLPRDPVFPRGLSDSQSYADSHAMLRVFRELNIKQIGGTSMQGTVRAYILWTNARL